MTDVTPIVLPSVQVAVNNAKSEVGAVRKQERNSAQGFNFRGIDAVVNACASALNKHGVVTSPQLVSYTYETVEVGQKKTSMAHVIATVDYVFTGPAGDTLVSRVLAEAMDSGDKACAKAMSVAYRIALLQTLNLPTDEPDPDSESYERSAGTIGLSQTPKITHTGNPGKIVKTGVKTDWAEIVISAKTVDALRDAWKDAGKAGALHEIVVGDGGEKMTVQELLYKRNDELSLTKSPVGAGIGSGENPGA